MKHLVYMVAGITVGFAVLLLAPASGQTPVGTTHLDLEMAPAATAGEVLEIVVTADLGAVVDLYVIDSYGTSHQQVGVDGEPVLVEVPATMAGRLDIIAISGAQEATATAVVYPANPRQAPAPMIGARSIVADGADRAMVVVISDDEFGNPTGGTMAAIVTVVHPDGTRAVHAGAATATLQWTWVPSVTTAGTAQVVVDQGGHRGATRTLIEIPAEPEPFAVEPVTELRPADGLTLVEVATTPLADRFGNRVVDGTAAVVTARYGDGAESIQTAVVVGGVARTLIEAADQPGIVYVRISVHGVTSSELALEFSAPLVPVEPSGVSPLRLVPLGGGQ